MSNNLMKKSIITIIIISLLISVSCKGPIEQDPEQEYTPETTVETSDTVTEKPKREINYELQPGEILTIETLDREGIRAFLVEPSLETLYEYCEFVIIYRKSERIPGNVEYQMLAPEKKIDSTEGGVYRVGAWPIYTSFIDYMNDIEGFEQILLERGIEAEVLSVVMFAHDIYMPKKPLPGDTPKACIWLHSDNGDYFLEFNFYLNTNFHDESYTYNFYDLTGYIEKLGYHDFLW